MSFKFLMNTPAHKETRAQLAHLLTVNTSARVYLTYGSIKSTANTQSIFSDICTWAKNDQNREIEVLAGIWQGDSQSAIETIAALLHAAVPNGTINCRTYGVKCWHVKAIGFTGLGKDFKQTSAAIFGSTNFTAGALTGANFEMDVYADRIDEELDGQMLRNYSNTIANLIRDGLNLTDASGTSYKHPGFHAAVKNEVNRLNDLHGTKCVILP